MTESKYNVIKNIYLPFTAAIDYFDIQIDIPFNVKKIRYINSSWGSADGKLGTTYSIGYVRSTIPQGNFLALLDTATSNKSFDIIYPQPSPIRGSYRFDISSPDGIHYTPVQNTNVFLTLEFVQE